MRTKVAIHIAEHLWDDTVQPGSVFDMLMRLAPTLEELRLAGKAENIREIVTESREEIIARWANVIMETENHLGDHGDDKVGSY